MRAIVALARLHGLFLYTHVGADAVQRMFRHNPGARVLGAHSGLDDTDVVDRMLKRYSSPML